MTVLVLELADSIRVDPPFVEQTDGGRIDLNFLDAITAGKTVKRYGTVGRFHISKWTGPEDTVSWNIRLNKAGSFNVYATYAAIDSFEGGKYTVSLGTETIGGTVHSTGKWYRYGTFPVGVLHVDEPGTYTLTMRPKDEGAEYLMYLKSMLLVPEKR